MPMSLNGRASSADASRASPPESALLWEFPLLAAIAVCLLSRIVAHLLWQVAYNPEPNIYQLLDSEVLKTAPFTSLYFMHIQPPLFNALYALSLALPDGAGPAFLQFLSVFATLTMMVVSYIFLRRFGYSAGLAGIFVAVFSLLPQVWGYEHVFFYAQFEAVLLVCSMLFASNYLGNRGIGHYCAFALCLLVLGLTRSLFHIGWIAVVLLAIAGMKSRRYGPDRPALVIASLSLAMLGAVYAKNLAEFSAFSVSSWLGINFAEISVPMNRDSVRFPVIVDDFQRQIKAGEFSQSAALWAAADDPWRAWLPTAQDCGEDNKAPRVLCATRKANGGPNMNHVAMLKYSNELGKDALHAIRLYPRLYVDRARKSFIQFFTTPSWDFFLAAPSLGRYADAWNLAFMYEPRNANPPQHGHIPWWVLARYPTSSLPIFILVVVTVLFVLIRAALEFCRYLTKQSSAADWVYPGVVVILFVLVPNLINGIESQRIRYSIEPILFLALAYGAAMTARMIAGRIRLARTGMPH
jgi:hypothetical protein